MLVPVHLPSWMLCKVRSSDRARHKAHGQPESSQKENSDLQVLSHLLQTPNKVLFFYFPESFFLLLLSFLLSFVHVFLSLYPHLPFFSVLSLLLSSFSGVLPVRISFRV